MYNYTNDIRYNFRVGDKMKIRRTLSNLERLCPFCNKDVNIKNEDYIATYSYRTRKYRVAHKECYDKECYDKYLEYVKNTWKNK